MQLSLDLGLIRRRHVPRVRTAYAFARIDGSGLRWVSEPRTPWKAATLRPGQRWTWTAPVIPEGFDALPWHEDPIVLDFLAAHPDGATFKQIGNAIGMTKEGVHGVLRRAVRKLTDGLRAANMMEDAGFTGTLKLNLRDMA